MVLGKGAPRGEHGFSLVESVIAVAVLGIIASAMVGGMATSIATSDIHRQQSVTNTVMVSAAEIVKKAPYVSCASAGTYSTAAVLPTGPPLLAAGAPPWPVGAIRTTVRYWNSQTSAWDVSPCHDGSRGARDGEHDSDHQTIGDGLGAPFPMQLVTILVTDPGNRASSSVDIIKRGP